ncbi:endonuclease SmrB [Alteromonas facilis]|uniref:endonuclease SmrB n=1 Tax=Alteromonas facilis TaxID=2048004 RepID=UPI001F0C6144|nr:endonuclease SmrB [Alteromonas facilis]
MAFVYAPYHTEIIAVEGALFITFLHRTDVLNDDDDLHLFRDSLKGVKPLGKNDKVSLSAQQKRALKKPKQTRLEGLSSSEQAKANAYFAFSDAFEGYVEPEGPVRYSSDREHHDEMKRLRRGDYVPELLLDLHGLSREEAKQELAALIFHAKQQHIACVCVVHGIGSGILKKQVPHWLIQHPDIIAFHQAPLEWGGKGALLVLLNNTDPKLG